MSKVWLITGAGSGIGAGIAKAALRAGDRVVATGRNLDKVRNALRDVARGASENLAFVRLDVADEAQLARKACVVRSPVPQLRHDQHDFDQRLSYSSWRRNQNPGSFSLRPRGARSSHWYVPQSPSNPRA
jgi:hypothetical protein